MATDEESIPPDVDALVLECLSKAPSRRPANADILLERLSNLSVAKRWEQRHARVWWELHDPELEEIKRRMARRAQFNPLQPAGYVPPSRGLSTGAWVAIGGGVLVVLAIVLLIAFSS